MIADVRSIDISPAIAMQVQALVHHMWVIHYPRLADEAAAAVATIPVSGTLGTYLDAVAQALIAIVQPTLDALNAEAERLRALADAMEARHAALLDFCELRVSEVIH
jgi:predicted nucleic acid-binding protein